LISMLMRASQYGSTRSRGVRGDGEHRSEILRALRDSA
jgi:hypothetical protein